MNSYNKQALDIIAKEQGFIRDNLEKVMRLVEILISMTVLCCLNLLFEDKEMVNRIKFHPMVLWKTRSR
ncbi:hypothetical protein [Segatella copri]|jgi:hypothetical protein|uniref:hypothetical protein n=1 Tax=Segatella copri TaxID=165179 RepID=UPI002586BE59|nr:hypothetical protein [Segatella copri]